MKRALMILVALVLCLCIGTSLADTYYVKSDAPLKLRDEYTNEVLTTIPVGTNQIGQEFLLLSYLNQIHIFLNNIPQTCDMFP